MPTIRLIYLSNALVPSREASAVNVMLTCDAFAGLGPEVTLRARRGDLPGSPADYYALRHPFKIVYENRFKAAAWLLARSVWPRVRADEVYFGRKISAVSALARRGHAVAVELHAPPRNQRKYEELRAIIDAPRLHGVVVISAQLRDEILKRYPQLDPARILVAHDGAPSAALRPPAARQAAPVRAVYCGRLLRGKGVDTVLQAARRTPQVEFHVIGGSPEQIAALSPSPANVVLHGHLPHAAAMALLPEFDIALAPYGEVVHGGRHKPDSANLANWMSPIKLFEYMAAGLPIVTSDLPVLNEIVQHERTALLTPPGHAAALGEAVARLAANADLRRQLATTAQTMLAENYTWDRRARRILDFLRPGNGTMAT